MPRDKLFDLAWKVGPVIAAIAMAWATMTGAVTQLQHDKLDTERFVVDSINKTRDLQEILRGQEEANQRLRDIQQALRARGADR